MWFSGLVLNFWVLSGLPMVLVRTHHNVLPTMGLVSKQDEERHVP